jgi:hypothetical protein
LYPWGRSSEEGTRYEERGPRNKKKNLEPRTSILEPDA